MDQKFLTARSPLRLLEKGLHGGLGEGNLGLILASSGIGKSSVLVGIALDALLQDGHVLHVSIDEPVNHVRAFYDTVFEDLASTTHMDHPVQLHSDLDRKRRIRSYSSAVFNSARLRDAVRTDIEGGGDKPTLVVLEGLDFEHLPEDELLDLKAFASELGAELWLSMSCDEEHLSELPESVKKMEPVLSVILTLEPKGGVVELRAMKDHNNPDVNVLRVGLDPKTMLLIRN